ncbi:MAG: YkgJ family cysteine cluster protein [Halodesulfurarchaeum sp.]
MELECRGCAGCCIDWRPLAPVAEHERGGPVTPLDDTYNLVPLTRIDVLDLLDAGYASAMTPRLWEAEEGHGVTIGEHRLAAIEGRPAFFLGLRTVPKPVDPFETDPEWLPTCVFLDPETLQCRIHDREEYPSECEVYPGHNLTLGAETECERVEAHFGGDRLLDDEPPAEEYRPRLGQQAIGYTVFAYPAAYAEDFSAVVDRITEDELRRADHAAFVAAAAASAPGTTAIEEHRFEETLERVKTADSWVGEALEEWEARAETREPDPSQAAAVEDARGAPETPGWPPD